MKPVKSKKLTLNSKTIRTLNVRELAQVNGGDKVQPTTPACTSADRGSGGCGGH
jgi:hypothetical protein